MKQDVFEHLLDIENSASTLVFDAQVEADKRISAAKVKSDAEYKTEYDKIIADFENNFLEEKQKIKQTQQNEYIFFEKKLKELKKDETKFTNFLNNYFFGSAING